MNTRDVLDCIVSWPGITLTELAEEFGGTESARVRAGWMLRVLLDLDIIEFTTRREGQRTIREYRISKGYDLLCGK